MNEPTFVTQAALRELVLAWRTDSATTLGASLDPDSAEVVPVHPADLPDLRRVYSRRLARCERGEGPPTRDLAQFVELLDEGVAAMFGWADDLWNYVGLIRDRRLFALTSAQRTDIEQSEEP